MIKLINSLFLCFILIVNTYAQIWPIPCPAISAMVTEYGVCETGPYTLVFNEDFNGDTLDKSKWNLMISNQGALQGQNSMEYNTYDNITVNGGVASIELKKETILAKAVNWLDSFDLAQDGLVNLRTYHYTSSNIWSKYKFQYGKYEIRCRIPNGSRMWPAFWLYGREPWNEIDVFEFLDMPLERPRLTVHYDYDYDEESDACGYNGVISNYSSTFHTYAVEWDNYAIKWYIDGVLMYSHDKFVEIATGHALDCNSLSPYQMVALKRIFPRVPMNIVFNLAYQDGPVDNLNSTKPTFEIDYIKYYQRSKCYNSLAINNTNSSTLFKGDSFYNFYDGKQIFVANYNMNNSHYIHLEGKDFISIEANTILSPSNNSWFLAVPNLDMACRFPKSNLIEDGVYKDFEYVELNDELVNLAELSIESDSNINEKECDFLIYPNPSNGVFNINGCSNHEGFIFELIDGIGRKISFYMNGESFFIDQISNGLYIGRIIDKEGNIIHTQKLIVNYE